MDDIEQEFGINADHTKPSAWTTYITRVAAVLGILAFIAISIAIISTFVIVPLVSQSQRTCIPRPKRPPPKVEYSQKIPILLKNATIYDGKGNLFRQYDLYMKEGRIRGMGESGTIKPDDNAKIIELEGRVITPGLVDLHSHAGVYSFPSTSAHEDGNEMTDPTTPMVRALDALRVGDAAIPEILKGGVTTSLILPGSGNVIGGEGVVIKMRGRTIDEMLVKDQKRYLKMACGENPKRYYGRSGKMPMSRMGSAWLLRKKFEEAREFLKKQDAWDCDPANWGKEESERPNSLALDLLTELLRGEVHVHWHCYETVDLEMAIRVAKEFGFKISAFHHAIEAWKLPTQLRENNISVATFAGHWGFKMEAYEASAYIGKILDEAGVDFVLKSDHPVTHAKYLMQQAGMAHHDGLNEHSAIAAVTSKPAKALGLDHRIGSLALDMDADVVVWDRHPLRNGATPYLVFVEGEEMHKNIKPVMDNSIRFPETKMEIEGDCNNPNYAITGATVYPMRTANDPPIQDAVVVVTNGQVSCLGTGTQCNIPGGHTKYSLKGGILIPGMIESHSALGLVEVSSEPPTQDGVAGVIDGSQIRAIDGVSMQSRNLISAWNGGVTTAISAPTGTNLVAGTSVAFYTYGTVVDDALVKWPVALHCNIGQSTKRSGTAAASISGQIATLRQYLEKAQPTPTPSNDPFVEVRSNRMKLVCTAHKADHIAHLLRLKKELNISMTIVGAAEAHMIANRIADAGVDVILTIRNPIPNSDWEVQRTDDTYGIKKLYDAGVRLGIATSSSGYESLFIRYAAGLAVDTGIPYQSGLAMITRNIAESFGIDAGKIELNKKANFVLFDENPLDFTGHIRLVALGGKVECNPKQQ